MALDEDYMSVSDESAGPPQKIPSKRVFRPLTAEQWNLARIQFETGDEHVNLPRIAAIFNTSLSSVQKRSAKESWSKGAKIVQDARSALQRATSQALATAAEKTGSEVAQRLMQDLQPFIEKEKRSHILRALKRSKRGMKRLDRVAKGFDIYDSKLGTVVSLQTGPKDEMQIAQAEDKYDSIIRRNLGMNDSTGLSGALSVRVLTEGAAIEVQQG